MTHRRPPEKELERRQWAWPVFTVETEEARVPIPGSWGSERQGQGETGLVWVARG